jgi:hypothetical protein
LRLQLLLPALVVLACAKDIVLPSSDNPDICGDGIVGPTEACDNPSAGCSGCQVTPGWVCQDNTCWYPCGDGISGDGTQCMNATKDLACDMTGWWIARENDAVRDDVVSAPQTASTWYLYRFSQTNGAFQVEQALHCGFHVTGSATVDCTPGTLLGLLYRNDPSVNGQHVRTGTFQMQDGGVCTWTFSRFYRIRGGTTVLVPTDFSTKPALADLVPLPYEDNPLQPTGAHLDNQEDTDGDGFPGASFQITGLATGIRESTQRDFKEYNPSGTETVPQNSISFTVHGNYDLQESVLSAQDCGYISPMEPGLCPFIIEGSHIDPTLIPRITMQYLGSDLASPRVAAVVVNNPGDNSTLDLETCANVRTALPHDPNP